MLRSVLASAFLCVACSAPETATAPVAAPPASSAANGVATDARVIHWQRSLDDAKALAAATGRPLLLALNMDGESASDRIVREQYEDPAFVALTRRCVCVGASVFRHNARDHDDHGRRIECPRFAGLTCGEHIALEPVMFDAYLADGERVAPRHALVMPGGKKSFDMSLNFDLKDVDRALAAAVGDSPVPAPPAVESDWNALAQRRDAAGRAALEAAVANARDEATVRDALAAIRAHGDRGSIDALRPLFARAATLSAPLQEEVVDVGCARDADAAFAAMRDVVCRVGADLADPGPDEAQASVTPERAARTPAQRAFVATLIAAWGGEGPRGLHDAVDFLGLLEAACIVTRREATPPRPGYPADVLPEVAELEQLLTELDAADAAARAAPDWQARFAEASLDLGRRKWEANAKGTALLFDDAARYFERATSAPGAKFEWWIERARCAYYRGRFAEQAQYGARAFALAAGTDAMPPEKDLASSPVFDDARAIEALRWLGDANARLVGERAGGDAGVELRGMIDALRSLGIVAASPFGREADWVTFGGFCGSLGLLREQVAATYIGARRFPASRDLRAALNAALWQCGRPELMPVAAEALERGSARSAEAAWFAGYAWILAAEDLRRRGEPRAAIAAYDRGYGWYRIAATRDPRYEDDRTYYWTVAKVGQGMAEAAAGEQVGAGSKIIAVKDDDRVKELRDGLGCDVLDLVDRAVEWTARGPSELSPGALLAWMNASGDDPFWANAISDAALREALRADGRNPERVERTTVDAGGKQITMPMGLPTQEGDEYLRQAIEAGRRAAANARSDDDKVPLAQALTIAAERQLDRGKPSDVAPFVAEAAPLVGLSAPAAAADEATLRALVAELRKKLGDARPRYRPGR